MSENWAYTAVWLPVIRSLEPASLNGFINRHKEISQTKKAQTPNPHSMTGAGAARLVTESDFMDPKCQAHYKPTSPTKRWKVGMSCTDKTSVTRSKTGR
jgi:hypothetical protein